MAHNPFLWLRTVRHFPLASLWQRLRLKISKKLYGPCPVPTALVTQWQTFWAKQKLKTEAVSLSFGHWQFQSNPEFQTKLRLQADQLLNQQQANILNQSFSLFNSTQELSNELDAQTPLWQENYGYLEFLLPLIWSLQSEADVSIADPQAIPLLETQLSLFWALSFQRRCWSTYGVSRRLLTYCELLPILTQLSTPIQQAFWAHFYQESRYLISFLEWDIQGNHLIQNLTAWLAVTIVFGQLPATKNLASQWEKELPHLLVQVFSKQVLGDGFHYERTPMYHLWVLRDLLECLSRLKSLNVPEAASLALTQCAQGMLHAGAAMLHVSGQIPLFGDSSLPQTPDFAALTQYASVVAGLQSSETIQQRPFHIFTKAGFAVFKNSLPMASLIVDCGDFAPRHLPAHAHCDLGSFELHGSHGPIIVDSGISDYVPSLLRDYFRGTAAHNTIWFPGQEQAEIWGSFRVAEYPRFKGCHIETDYGPMAEKTDRNQEVIKPNIKLNFAYENYNAHYTHQRSVTHISQRFWIVEETLKTATALQAGCWSLLHIHPDCAIELKDGVFTVDQELLIIPFGAQSVEWSDQAPWRENLNLYSPGFNLAKPGQLIAQAPGLSRSFGWLLIPYLNQVKPHWQWQDERLTLTFPEDDVQFAFKVLPEGLRQCAPEPAPSIDAV